MLPPLPLLLVSLKLPPLLLSSSPGSAYRAALRALRLSDAPVVESGTVDNAAGGSENTAVLESRFIQAHCKIHRDTKV